MAVNLITSFPAYSRDEDCNHNRHWCGTSWAQATSQIRLPPWAILNPGTGTLAVWAHNRKTDTWADITTLVTTASTTVGSDTYLIYNWSNMNAVTDVEHYDEKDGTLIGDITWTAFTANCAEIQLVVDKGVTSWYFNLFYVNQDLDSGNDGAVPTNPTGHILIDWSDDKGVGDIPYKDITFGQRLFLPTDIGRPQYPTLIDGPENGDRVQVPTFRRVIKQWLFTALVPEYITDALALMCIHKTVVMHDQYSSQYTIQDPELTVDWSRSDCNALATLTFRNSLSIKDNC